MGSERDRFLIAEEIVRRCDTVTLLTCAEVADTHARAQAGEFDDFWERDENGKTSL